ncbi:hypothetical protein TWF103_003122 [Orbilia oligospora]|nr:hypothetical protein TWF103_003122 [Orbilia oligospora]
MEGPQRGGRAGVSQVGELGRGNFCSEFDVEEASFCSRSWGAREGREDEEDEEDGEGGAGGGEEDGGDYHPVRVHEEAY